MTTQTDILRLNGSQQEMGFQHGAIVKGLGGYQDLMAYYPTMPQGMLFPSATVGPVERVARAAMTPLVRLVLRRLYQARSLEYRQRTEAFGQGLGIGDSRKTEIGVMDIAQNIIGTLTKMGLVPFAQRAASALPPMCSSIAVWGRASADGRVLHGRNFDFPGQGMWEKRPAVVFCTPDDGMRYGFVTSRGADIPGITSFNEAGITLAMHTRFHRDVRYDGRSVVDLSHDLIRRAETLQDAIAIARERPSASSWGVLVSSAKERDAVLLEVTASRVEVIRPGRDESFLVHTNRYRHPALQVDEVTPSAAFVVQSDGRFECLLDGIVRHAAEGMDVHDMCALLGSHFDPRTGQEEVAGGILAQPDTVQSVVVDPENQAVHIGVGQTPVSRMAWKKVDWSWDGAEHDVLSAPPAAVMPSRFSQGNTGKAWRKWAEACRLQHVKAPVAVLDGLIEQAVSLDPEQAWYRLLAGTMALRRGEFAGGLKHLEVGLTHERFEFRTGQLLLWASRAAAVTGDSATAAAHRRALLNLSHPMLASHRAAAMRETSRPMGSRKLTGIPIHLTLADV